MILAINLDTKIFQVGFYAANVCPCINNSCLDNLTSCDKGHQTFCKHPPKFFCIICDCLPCLFVYLIIMLKWLEVIFLWWSSRTSYLINHIFLHFKLTKVSREWLVFSLSEVLGEDISYSTLRNWWDLHIFTWFNA